jgi:hypothetical protein
MNLYPLQARLPRNLPEVDDRVHEIGYASRLRQDRVTAERINEFIATIEALAALVPTEALTGDAKRRIARARQYKTVEVVDIDMQDPSETDPAQQDVADDRYGLRDFSAPTIERRRANGYALAMRRLAPLF